MGIGNPLDLVSTSEPASSNAANADKNKANRDAAKVQADGSNAGTRISCGPAASAAETNNGDELGDKRIDQFKAAMADGTFKVNVERVADKVIASNLEALSRSKH